jgi:predicted nucleotidyltransferase
MAETTWADFRAAIDRRIAAELAREQELGEHARADVVPRVRAAISAARAAGACGRAWLFGSHAWGVPHAESDVDLMVDGLTEDGCAFAERIGAFLGARDIHVVPLGAASDSLRERVLREGVLL